ncbi:MAG: HPr(Ser) kinase/phosphatase [Gammaproteobacteria bacterium]
MSMHLSVADLYDALCDKLALSWVAGRAGATRQLRLRRDQPTAVLAGYLNFIHPTRLSILGSTEMRFLRGLDERAREDALQRLFSRHTGAVIVADAQAIATALKQRADVEATPLLRTRLPSQDLLGTLQYYLTQLLAEKTILHGVFMEVMGIGVFITGSSGVGKSELALELLSRGHRLIADDAPEFARLAPDIVSGACPVALRDFLEVRGLGLLNVRALYGDSAVKSSKYLRLIVNLEHMTDARLRRLDRLRGSRRTRKILGMDVPEITLPVAPGRNLAVLIEAAARNHILFMKGYDAGDQFINDQQALIDRDEP